MSFLFIEHWKVSCELKVVDILEEKKDIIEHKISTYQWSSIQDKTFEIEARPDILDYIFLPLVPFNYIFRR